MTATLATIATPVAIISPLISGASAGAVGVAGQVRIGMQKPDAWAGVVEMRKESARRGKAIRRILFMVGGPCFEILLSSA